MTGGNPLRALSPEEREVWIARSMLRSMIHCVGIALLVLGFVVLFWLKAQIEHRPAVHTYGFGDGDVFPWYLFVVVGAIIGVPLILAVRRLRRARRALERAGTTSA